MVLRPGGTATATATELRAHCRQQLSKYKLPARVELEAALPKNAIGKFDKPALRLATAKL